ncbi:uncharacterized protein B0H64DRAFT_403764 [Chaetomium fimeti]|uniref:Uncharacterized protein n=1 Tax=Chaetomium fimeti TaxID=1854472 RepID=A0AAE0HB26_9PEZI|nr:hypothetical protein B0H64DRAFT_403764 [Chaetomium fimeti]
MVLLFLLHAETANSLPGTSATSGLSSIRPARLSTHNAAPLYVARFPLYSTFSPGRWIHSLVIQTRTANMAWGMPGWFIGKLIRLLERPGRSGWASRGPKAGCRYVLSGVLARENRRLA